MIRFAFLLLVPFASFANSGVYKPSTLRVVNGAGTGGNLGVGKGTADFFASMPTYSVLGEYTGDSRPISATRLQFIAEYAKMSRQPTMVESYKREIKVKEGTFFYWIPVQESFFADLGKELKNNQKFVIYLGVAGKTVDRDTVLLMMDFSSDKADVDNVTKELTQQSRGR